MTAKHTGTPYSSTPVQLLSTIIILMIVWLLWSGLYKPLLIGLGIFSCLLSLWVARRTGFFRHTLELRAYLRLPALWWWLLKEVVVSSIEVAKIVLSPSLPIQPELVELSSTEQTDSGKVILGNSITLSPGTVTIDVHEDRLLVHCLTASSAASLRSREVDHRVAQLGIR